MAHPTSVLDDKFWEIAQLVMPSHTSKERITMRIDSEVLDWLKDKGPGYQSRINSILRSFMKTEKTHTKNKTGHARR